MFCSRIKAFVFFGVLSVSLAVSPVMAAADQEALTVTAGSRISINVDNKPLSAVLRMMAEKKLFNITGGGGGSESLTLHFTDLTLSEALARMMKGYNYVLVEDGKGRPPALTVMGKVERPNPTAQANANVQPAAGEASLANAPAPAEPRSYVPPTPMSPPAQTGMQPPQGRQPRTQQQAGGAAQSPASGQQAAAPSSPAVQAQPAPSQGASQGGQPADADQKQGTQQAVPEQPLPDAPPPPAESRGVRF
jgi:hypothetical protein